MIELDGAAEVEAGQDFTLAVLSDSSAWAWGWNLFGQLGDGTTRDRGRPMPVEAPL